MYALRQVVDIGRIEQKSRSTSIIMQHFLCTPNTSTGVVNRIGDSVSSSYHSKHRRATRAL